ncbi:hypothetical protein MTR67_002523 [Solanum verrucosum]|uniref:Integrase catalytic domain-containing protein n=1 Tax=Solanum verrucosum TaxID=315347 RepID=A0AAF0PQN1_SOLVR|nr:hypothetical protein MTR67_002523 [Solanum verrucosum]
MKKDIAVFVAKCSNCQQVKVQHQKPGGLAQDIGIPTWKWEDVNMDFIVGLPRPRCQHYSIWVIVDLMTKSTHFLPGKVFLFGRRLCQVVFDRMGKITWCALVHYFDRGTQFTSQILKSFQKGLGTKVKLSTTFNPPTDGQAK